MNLTRGVSVGALLLGLVLAPFFSDSKVRAMTRIATPNNEEALLNVAEHGTAAHVDKLVLGTATSSGSRKRSA